MNEPRRITVLDDHVGTLELLRDILESAGFAVSVTPVIDPQLHALRDTNPDLIIVDLRLDPDPRGLSGWDVVRLAKSHAELYRVPSLVISADYPTLSDCRREAQTMSRIELLAKPFSVDDLLAAIERLLADAGSATAARTTSHRQRPPLPR